jgi:lysylphosphatidylglycerol synthetase-like protein (DUF2156 family)
MKRPISVITTYIFILLNALIWLILSILLAVNALPGLPDVPGIKWVLALLSIIMAGIILVLFIFLYRGSRRAYYFTLVIFSFTAVLTIFDDVGLSDIGVLALNIIPIILLIIDRAWYLRAKHQTT